MGDNRYCFRYKSYTEVYIKASTEEEARGKLLKNEVRSRISGMDSDIENAELIETKIDKYNW